MTKHRFAKRFRYPTSETSYEEYPAGAEAELSSDRLKAARAAKVLAEPDAEFDPKAKT